MITKEMWEGRFVDNELTAEYFDICSRVYNGKGHKHHILPKSLWPEFRKSDWNLVNLSYEDHYLVHKLLPDICLRPSDKAKMLKSWFWFVGESDISAEEYSAIMSRHRSAISGQNHPNYGKKFDSDRLLQMSAIGSAMWDSEELRLKQSETVKNLWKDPEYKTRVSANMVKSRADSEYRDNQSAKAKERWNDEQYASKVLAAIESNSKNPERNKKISDKAKERCKSEEFLAKLSNVSKAAWASEEKRNKQAETIRNKHKTDKDYHDRMAALNVLYTYERRSSDGSVLLETYKCSKDFEDRGYSRGSVSLVCTGVRKLHKGFSWRRYPAKHLTNP